MNTAGFLKYVWPFYNIMHERVNETHLGARQNSKIKLFPDNLKPTTIPTKDST